MNTIRMIAIALPMMLLIACGGGGGGGGTVSPTTMTPPTNTPDPNMPPTVTLPGYALDAAMARTHTGGTAPTSMTEMEIVTAIQTRATAADTFDFSNFVGGTADVDITCSDTNKSCSGNVPDVDMLTFSLSDIKDLSLVDDMGLMGFDSDTEIVMEDAGATIIQSQAAAGQNDGTHLTFQTYGGWVDNSVFGVELMNVTEDGTDTLRYTSFSFGNDSGSNPTGASLFQYVGVMVGTNTETGHVIHGDAIVQYDVSTANIVDTVSFSNATNLNDGSRFTFGSSSRIDFGNIPLTNGSFESASGDIKGSFYGTSHEEIGGIFNSSTYNLIGAFGGTKQ